MSGSPRKSGRARLPWGLVGALAMIALAESFVARQSLIFMDSPDLDWKTSGRLAAARASRYDVLCFGDSMVKFGIAPRVLESTLKRPVYSLALLDGKPPASYYLLRRALESGARPRAVIVDFQPEMIAQPTWHLLQNPHWPGLLLNPAEALDMAWHYRDADFFGRLVVARGLPTYRCRAQVRAQILAALEGESVPNRAINAPVRRNWQVNNGGILLPKQPAYRGDVPLMTANDLFSMHWTTEPTAARYVLRFLALAESYKVPVFWLLPPNAPRVVEDRTVTGLYDRYDAFVRGALDRFPNLTILDARRSDYAHTVFVDPVHLDREGAAVLSADVAGEIRRALAPGATSPRWVALPKYHAPPARPRLEDVDQSKLAVRLEEGRARR